MAAGVQSPWIGRRRCETDAVRRKGGRGDGEDEMKGWGWVGRIEHTWDI